MTNGIRQQVGQRTTHHRTVSGNVRLPREDDLHAFLLGQRFVEVNQCPRLSGQIDRFGRGQQMPVFGLGKKQHVADHACNALVLLEVGGKNVAVLVRTPGMRQGDLGLGHQVRDWRA